MLPATMNAQPTTSTNHDLEMITAADTTKPRTAVPFNQRCAATWATNHAVSEAIVARERIPTIRLRPRLPFTARVVSRHRSADKHDNANATTTKATIEPIGRPECV